MSQVAPLGSRAVPGSDGGKVFHLLDLISNGHGYFGKRRKRTNCTVFKVNMGIKGVAVCDRQAVDIFWDVNKVYKEPAFGRLSYNTSLLDGYTPSMFSNGVAHDQQKAFVMNICEVAQKAKIIPAAIKVIKEYLTKWDELSSRSGQNSQCCSGNELEALKWEVDIMHLTSDIMTEAFLGVRVDPQVMYKVLKASWTKGKKDLRRAITAANHLRQSFRETPAMRSIFEIAEKAGISEDQAVVDVLFMLNFNSCGGVGGATTSCLARLAILDQKLKDEIKQEICQVLQSSNYELNEESLGKMEHLQRFIYEVLRLHPPVPVFFARTRDDTTLHSSSGSFSISKGTLLVANSHIIQRDPTLFSDPDTFRPSRFENKQLLEHLIYSYGPFTENPTEQNHHCAGKEITFATLKVILIYVIVCCDFELTSRPYWSGKKLRRIGSPDKIVKLKYFNYDPTKLDPMVMEDVPSPSEQDGVM